MTRLETCVGVLGKKANLCACAPSVSQTGMDGEGRVASKRGEEGRRG